MSVPRTRVLLLLLLLLLLVPLLLVPPGCGSRPEDRADPSSPYTHKAPSDAGSGRVYMGREISGILGHRGVAWLERAEREEERPELIVGNLDLRPDSVVADVGAGTGYLTFRISPLVPEGQVLAVDVQPQMLQVIERRREDLGADNVSAILGTETDPQLPAGGVDVALMVDAYHEFSHPLEMMQAIAKALKPGGRAVVVEYRAEDPSSPVEPLHRMEEEQIRKEMAAVGLRWVENRDLLPRQHFVVLERP